MAKVDQDKPKKERKKADYKVIEYRKEPQVIHQHLVGTFTECEDWIETAGVTGTVYEIHRVVGKPYCNPA